MKYFMSGTFHIQYDVWGDSAHQPVLFFHGFPGSHVQARALLPLLKQNKIYLIACDRPGYGGSTGTGSDAQYLHAVKSLLEHLDIEKFHILGVSGGAPFAHMMASLFAEKVRSLNVICGLATYNKETKKFFSKFQNRAMLARRFIPGKMTEVLINSIPKNLLPEKNLDKLLALLDSTDREVLQQAHHVELLTHSMNHSQAQGAKGIAWDSAFFHRDWLNDLCDSQRLKSLPVFYFHGMRDRVLNHEMSEWMHKRTPGSQLRFFQDEGHYSLPLRRADSILQNLSSCN